nr:hypothetical protein [Nostoc sp. DedSLP05]MDZ8099067.1 hypothetical protein [Nostoc sp. DedSLP01]
MARQIGYGNDCDRGSVYAFPLPADKMVVNRIKSLIPIVNFIV